MSHEDMGPVTDGTADVVAPKELSSKPYNPIAQSQSSGWVQDDNHTRHTTMIPHSLGKAPSVCQVWFTATGQQEYLVNWSWEPSASGNPVTISANESAVFLEIAKGFPLHGVWEPQTGWTKYSSGYWRIVVA